MAHTGALRNWWGFWWAGVDSRSGAVGNRLTLWGGRCRGGDHPGRWGHPGGGSTLGGGYTLGGGVSLVIYSTLGGWSGMSSGVVGTGGGISEAVSGF